MHGGVGSKLDLNFVGLESGLDVVLGQRVGAVVRDMQKLLQSKKSFEDELGLDLEELRCEYSYTSLYVLVIVGTPGGESDALSMNTKKWAEILQRLRETKGVQPLLCLDASDVAAHLLALLRAERAAGRALRRCMPASEPAVRFLREAPGVSYSTAVSVVAHFRGRKMSQLLHCGAGDLKEAAPWTTDQQRRNLLHFFGRAFGGSI